jgi:hypothetical protein
LLLICIAGVAVSIAVAYFFAGFPLPSFLQDPFGQWRATLADLSRVGWRRWCSAPPAWWRRCRCSAACCRATHRRCAAPLDVALDVDNYFREFPRKQIPRAPASLPAMWLLEHVALRAPSGS